MKINPKQLSWSAPTTNVDGTPIDYDLEYEVGIVNGDAISTLMVVPAQLREGVDYVAPIEGLSLASGRVYSLALRAFAKEDSKRVSQWAISGEFAISDRVPSPPLAFAVS